MLVCFGSVVWLRGVWFTVARCGEGAVCGLVVWWYTVVTGCGMVWWWCVVWCG